MQSQFTTKEIQLFEKRYDHGYDLKHDRRYNLWIKCYHPEKTQSKSTEKCNEGVCMCS